MILASCRATPAVDSGILATTHAGISGATVTTAGATIADPASGAVLQVGLKVRVGPDGGSLIDANLLAGAWSVSASLQEAGASGTIPPILPGAVKDPLTYRSSPGGADYWYLYFAIRGADGVLHEYPLISAGIARDGQRTYGIGEALDSLSVADRLARFRGVRVNRHLRAGHNLPTWRVVQTLANAAGWSGVDMPRVGTRHRRPLQIVNGDWFGPAQQLASAQGLELYVDGRGFLTAAVDRPELGSPAARWSFGPDDIVESVDGSPVPVVVSAPNGVLWKVCVTSSEQVTAGGNRPSTVELESRAAGNFAPKPAPWRQSTGGTRTAVSGVTVAAAERLRRRTVTRITRQADAVLAIEVTQQRYINPTAAPRVLNADGSVSSYRVVYQEDDTDTSPAHVWSVERLVEPAARSSNSRTYDTAGYLASTVEESYGYRNVERAIRSRATQGADWETATGPAGLYVLADGTGVVDTAEIYRLVSRVETEYGQVDGYQASQRTITYGYRKRSGWKYLYADGSLSSDEREQWGVVRDVEETWINLAEEGLHYYEQTIRGPDGQLASDVEEPAIQEIREGGPPGAEKVADLSPQLSDYDTVEEWRDALAASAWETRDLLVRKSRTGLAHPYEEAELSVDYVETQAGLDAHADRLLIKSAAMPVVFTVLPKPGLERGHVAHVRCPARLTLPGESVARDVSLDHDVYIEGWRIYGSESGAAVLLEVSGSIR